MYVGISKLIKWSFVITIPVSPITTSICCTHYFYTHFMALNCLFVPMCLLAIIHSFIHSFIHSVSQSVSPITTSICCTQHYFSWFFPLCTGEWGHVTQKGCPYGSYQEAMSFTVKWNFLFNRYWGWIYEWANWQIPYSMTLLAHVILKVYLHFNF